MWDWLYPRSRVQTSFFFVVVPCKTYTMSCTLQSFGLFQRNTDIIGSCLNWLMVFFLVGGGGRGWEGDGRIIWQWENLYGCVNLEVFLMIQFQDTTSPKIVYIVEVRYMYEYWWCIPYINNLVPWLGIWAKTVHPVPFRMDDRHEWQMYSRKS